MESKALKRLVPDHEFFEFGAIKPSIDPDMLSNASIPLNQSIANGVKEVNLAESPAVGEKPPLLMLEKPPAPFKKKTIGSSRQSFDGSS